MSSPRVDFFRKYAQRYNDGENNLSSCFMISDQMAWCLDRALENVLYRRDDDCVCFARFHQMRRRDRVRGLDPALEFLVDASDPEACVSVFLRGYKFLDCIAMYESELDTLAQEFFDRALKIATVECAICCYSNGVEIPTEIIDLERWIDHRAGWGFAEWLWHVSSFRKYSNPIPVVDWFRKNAPELFEAAFDDARDRLYISIASKFEGVVELMLNRVPIREGDPLFTSYDPPLSLYDRRAAKYISRTFNLSRIISAMGQYEPFACELVMLMSDDGMIHVDKTSSFMTSDLVDTDFGLVVVEAVKAGFIPHIACDWEAGSEYISRLADALRMGIPFVDLIAGEGRDRIADHFLMSRLDV